ncbi:hypothetical protein PUNSTDRAFT_127343 [Punctularia strigosozonata HHB-11173 SS5]|uniref:uncharacterized protein n=1 Tax=Punctularia strigosozonata (strain HHB-11173) TaxID=741275 RepID=UPI00044185C5|nr:uncharacterized protein PUNSTDRAFT_127343 [Punctularia strigosozonata HHB-11173 SS5]EIN06649.1 hypothetical protein PUNSTDRAFT_127343 [Punctularia strigosozonata HHB-11173 SS5]
MKLRRYHDALKDARKATDLDPRYAKAWARLATAQERLQYPSIGSWERALACLPTQGLSLVERKQKEQYTAGLRAAEAYAKAKLEPIRAGPLQFGAMPWDRAAELKVELQKRAENGDASANRSSAWVICGAYRDFEDGMTCMRSIKSVLVPGTQQFAVSGPVRGLEFLSNAVLRDSRVFHFKLGDRKFDEMYNDQDALVTALFRSWQRQSAEQVIESAQKRLKNEGWTPTRTALSATVRSWILRGYITGCANTDTKASAYWYGEALHVLEWGQQTWKKEQKAVRGAIFEHTFVRGVRGLHLDAYMQSCAWDATDDPEYSWERVLEEAQEQLRDIRGHPIVDPDDPGFSSSFCDYPRGQAFAAIGLYFKHLARFGPDKDQATVNKHLDESASMYLAAAHAFPADDEHHAWFLYCGVEIMFEAGRPLSRTLPIISDIREVMPKYKPIWENSLMGRKGMEQKLQMYIDFASTTQKSVDEGTHILESVVWPDWFLSG